MSKPHDGKCLLAWMREQGLTEYGSIVSQDTVRGVIGIEMPDVASKRVFDGLALRELSATDYVRNVLLGEGKYLAQDRGEYRILLPSQNHEQVERYMSNADSKLKRALKLVRNMPQVDIHGPPDNLRARLLMKREGIKDFRDS